MLYQILLTGDGPPVVNVEMTDDEARDLAVNRANTMQRVGDAYLRPSEVRVIAPTGL